MLSTCQTELISQINGTLKLLSLNLELCSNYSFASQEQASQIEYDSEQGPMSRHSDTFGTGNQTALRAGGLRKTGRKGSSPRVYMASPSSVT